ncbi:MAG: DUF3822 family protein [Paludibacteraceae bacterium]|nr:DUF3822 family protein [Paludibacteraceae bacterium]
MVEIAESSFDPADSPNHTLSIRFLPDGFCFVVASLTERRPLYFCLIKEAGKSVMQQFTEQLNKLDSLRRKYSEVFFLNDDKAYTLMPSAILNESDKIAYWKFSTQGDSSNVKIMQDSMELCGAALLHSISAQLSDLLSERFPSIRFIHRQSILATQTMMRSKESGEESVSILMGNGRFDLVAVKEGVLQMANTFSRKNDEEFLYFTLNVFDQLKMDPYKTKVTIQGDVTDKDSAVTRLNKYVSDVTVHAHPSVELGKSFSKSNICQKQMILFDLPSCV